MEFRENKLWEPCNWVVIRNTIRILFIVSRHVNYAFCIVVDCCKEYDWLMAGEQLDIMYIYGHFDETLNVFMMRKKSYL